jgi:hypothetical protein
MKPILTTLEIEDDNGKMLWVNVEYHYESGYGKGDEKLILRGCSWEPTIDPAFRDAFFTWGPDDNEPTGISPQFAPQVIKQIFDERDADEQYEAEQKEYRRERDVPHTYDRDDF